MQSSSLQDIRVIDSDSHIIEPPDLWTSRVAKKWVDQVPHVELDENADPRWRVGDTWLATVGYYGWAGWSKHPPAMPTRLEELEPGAHDPVERLRRLDDFGVYAQVLYPNIVGFEAPTIMRTGTEVSLECTRAYNDFLLDWASADPKRFIPIAMVPFWNIEASIAEMTRCAKLGHRGILFANRYEVIDLPVFTASHWDPIYAAAQDLEMSINFHVGFTHTSGTAAGNMRRSRENFDPRNSALVTSLALMSNHESIAQLLTSGLCERFPRLKFVSVESGFGYVPYLMEVLDWHWKGYGAAREYEMLPSECFRRQVYGSLWFETTTLSMLEQYPDNFMFETDYPHPTSLSPGPASYALKPSDHLEKYWGDVPEALARKVLHDNAAALYRWD